MFESVNAHTDGRTQARVPSYKLIRAFGSGELKMKELERSQGFPYYNPMGAICCHGNQSSNPIWPKT